MQETIVIEKAGGWKTARYCFKEIEASGSNKVSKAACGDNEMLELFIVFFKLGAFTIGGGIAMLPLLQNELIHSKKWFTEDEFLDAVAVCQSMPGVVAVNMASYVGYRRKGPLGSLLATIGVVLPSLVIILAVASGLAHLGDNRYVNGAMAGFRAAALGLVLVSVFQLSSAVFRKGSKLTMMAAAAAFALIVLLHIDTAYVVLLFLLLGVIASIMRGRNANANTLNDSDASDDIGANAEGGGK